jgi:hypothetical protein
LEEKTSHSPDRQIYEEVFTRPITESVFLPKAAFSKSLDDAVRSRHSF